MTYKVLGNRKYQLSLEGRKKKDKTSYKKGPLHTTGMCYTPTNNLVGKVCEV